MSKVGGHRNYGFGKSFAWAGKNALKGRYGHGHFATRAAHAARWTKFAAFAKSHGIRDVRDVTDDLFRAYASALAAHVETKTMSVRYAQNLVSSVNVVLGAMRGDRRIRLSPARGVGQRTDIRSHVPVGLDRALVNACVKGLNERGHDDVASVATLARDLGLRFREASLLDARQAANEAQQKGHVTITRGTKGGRGREFGRTVPVTAEGITSLQRAAAIQGSRENLIPDGMTFLAWRDHAYGVWRRSAQSATPIGGFHDLRAAYACERYEALTGHAAPVVAGHRAADREPDRAAREVISEELGHGRIEVVAAYVGSGR
jgi:hypothetical protein